MRSNLGQFLLFILAGLCLLSAPLVAQTQPDRVLATSNPPVDDPVLGTQCACSAGSTIMVDQAPNQSNGLFNDSSCPLCGTGQQSIADNFVATEDTLNEVRFWSGYFPSNTPLATDDYTIIVHDDAAGLPGAAISTQTGLVPTCRETTGIVLFGVNEYVNLIELAPVPLVVGNTYWVEIFNNSAALPNDQVFWEVGNLDPINGVLDGAFATATPGVTWMALGATDLAWQACQGTPPPPPPPPDIDFTEIPTLNHVGVITLVVLLGIAGIVVVRRFMG